jgi:hypothetical protein
LKFVGRLSHRQFENFRILGIEQCGYCKVRLVSGLDVDVGPLGTMNEEVINLILCKFKQLSADVVTLMLKILI